MAPRIGIILVNYNGGADTAACLDSLRQLRYSNHFIVLVDNASPDASGVWLREVYPDVEVLQSAENTGFAGGNNQGIKRALEKGAEYLLLLNNDTEADPDFIARLVEAADGNTAAVPKIYYHSQPDIIWSAGGYIDKGKGVGRHYGLNAPDGPEWNTPKACTFATGCCWLLPKRAVETVGLLDESLFMYYEDVDYCIRLAEQGFAIRYVPAARIWHKVGAAGANGLTDLAAYYDNRNRFYVIDKHRNYFGRGAKLYSYCTRYAEAAIAFFRRRNGRVYLRAMRDYRRGVKGNAQRAMPNGQ